MTNKTTSRFPAILLGGPPHAGKSVLAYSLKEALRENGVQCYLLRAAPDGEGDWSQLAQPELAQTLRRKGKHTPTWIERMCRDIAYRPLPFLVDVGGKPEPWQETLFDQCTHAILLVKDAESQALWQELTAKYNIPVLALLTSKLEGGSILEADQPILTGVISNLNRGQRATGPIFEALLARVQALFRYDYDELLTIHQEQAPTDLVVDIPRLYRRINPTRSGLTWQPQDLPAVFEYLPPDTSLALYGIGPAWLYAAVASYIYPNTFFQFDARRGWVEPVRFSKNRSDTLPINVKAEENENCLHLKLDLLEDYLVYQPELALPLPSSSQTQGVILDGKLPNWLYTGLTLFYRSAQYVAIYYPHLDRAVIVASQFTKGPHAVGQVLSLADCGPFNAETDPTPS
ncbi:MAG: hypothetical protein HS126_40600 [Anaerolineales bacterium]|nr:hypothetical protein [Anaerolineales bacterium]